ncbi:hypothetical protein A1F99_121100 [Pyrenophora tritici-repentis]|nr:hypothetical protein A1F99_121100 [Pyrenophora tritici-repentis]
MVFEKREHDGFLQRLEENNAEPTWGFYVYGTYARPQEQSDKDDDIEESKAQKAAKDEAYFQTVLYTLHAHAADSLRYGYPVPYNHLFIDTLRLKPAAYLPGASLSEVCTHFCQHYGQIADPTRRFDPEYEASLDPEKLGPQYNWCLVIDDECLDSLQCAPEPTGPNPPEDLHPSFLASSAGYVFVKMLSAYHNTMEKPGVLASQGRGGMRRRRIEWNGWLMFSPVDIMRAFREADTGEFETLFEGEDELADHSDYSD